MSKDTLSIILSLVEARAVTAGGFTAGGRWAVRFPPPHGLKFFVMARGESILQPDGIAELYQLRQGDVFLLRSDQGFIISSETGISPLDAMALFDVDRPEVVDLGGDDILFLGGHIDIDAANSDLLLSQIPPAIHIRAEDGQASGLAWLIRRFVKEQSEDAVGAGQAACALAQLLFIELLRAYAAQAQNASAGWIRAMVNRRLSPALRLIHDDPAAPLSVDQLARHAGMSRTAFAVHFRAVMGVAPLAYLTRWRMQVAAKQLRTGTPIATLAASVGYASDAAFSTAFKRVFGKAPKHYRDMVSTGSKA